MYVFCVLCLQLLKQFRFNCIPAAFPLRPTTVDAFVISWGELSYSLVHISPCPVLSAILSRLFLLRDHLQIYGIQDFASVVETC